MQTVRRAQAFQVQGHHPPIRKEKISGRGVAVHQHPAVRKTSQPFGPGCAFLLQSLLILGSQEAQTLKLTPHLSQVTQSRLRGYRLLRQRPGVKDRQQSGQLFQAVIKLPLFPVMAGQGQGPGQCCREPGNGPPSSR